MDPDVVQNSEEEAAIARAIALSLDESSRVPVSSLYPSNISDSIPAQKLAI